MMVNLENDVRFVDVRQRVRSLEAQLNVVVEFVDREFDPDWEALQEELAERVDNMGR